MESSDRVDDASGAAQGNLKRPPCDGPLPYLRRRQGVRADGRKDAKVRGGKGQGERGGG